MKKLANPLFSVTKSCSSASSDSMAATACSISPWAGGRGPQRRPAAQTGAGQGPPASLGSQHTDACSGAQCTSFRWRVLGCIDADRNAAQARGLPAWASLLEAPSQVKNAFFFSRNAFFLQFDRIFRSEALSLSRPMLQY